MNYETIRTKIVKLHEQAQKDGHYHKTAQARYILAQLNAIQQKKLEERNHHLNLCR